VNFYSYVEDSPINYIDPLGHAICFMGGIDFKGHGHCKEYDKCNRLIGTIAVDITASVTGINTCYIYNYVATMGFSVDRVQSGIVSEEYKVGDHTYKCEGSWTARITGVAALAMGRKEKIERPKESGDYINFLLDSFINRMKSFPQ
jgi:hypothetical protein